MSDPLQVRTDGTTVVATFPGAWLRVEHGAPVRLQGILARNPGAAFVVNGPMFEGNRSPRFLLIDAGTGLRAPSDEPAEGVTVWTDGERAYGAYGADPPAGAVAAVQGWPSLVVNGEVTATNVGTNAEHDWRPGIGVLADGRVIVVALVGTMVDLARRMQVEGAAWAGYLDGGSSLQLSGGGVTRESSRVAPVPTWVLAVPSPAKGRRAWPWVAGAACVGALGYVAWSARRGGDGTPARANPGRIPPAIVQPSERGPSSFICPCGLWVQPGRRCGRCGAEDPASRSAVCRNCGLWARPGRRCGRCGVRPS